MTDIRVRFRPPGSETTVAGTITFTARHVDGNRPVVDGQDIILGQPQRFDVPAEGATISLRPTGPGWYYSVQGRADGHSFSTNKLVPPTGPVDFESLVRFDPKVGLAYEPEPPWWAHVKAIGQGGTASRDAAGLMSAAHWTRVDTGSVSVLNYGAKGDGVTDDTTAIQAAVNAALGRPVVFPGGAYRITSTVLLPSNTTLSTAGTSVTIDVSGMADGTPALQAEGTFDTAQALADDLQEGDRTMTPASTSGLTAGDYLKITSSQVFGSTNQPRGEIVRIKSIEDGVVTFEDPLHDSYPVASDGTYQKVNFAENITLEGFNLTGPSDVRNVIATRFIACRNVILRNLRSANVHNAVVHLTDVVESSVSDCHFKDCLLPGFGYGVAFLWACQDITMTNCTGITMRHLVTTGGGTGRRGIIRRLAVSNCTTSQMFEAGFDAHPASEYVSFIGCHVNGSEQDGIVMQSGRFTISGCTVSDSARYGIMVQVLTIRGLDGVVSGNVVKGAGNRGIITTIGSTTAWHKWSGLSVTGNVVTDSGFGITVENGSTSFSVSNVCVTGNTINRINSSHAMHLRGLTAPVVNGNHVTGAVATREVLFLQNCPESVVSGNLLDGTDIASRCLRIVSSPDSTVTGNLLKRAGGQGVLTDTNSNNLVYMGNRNLCATKGTLAGTGHLQSTADHSGAYNL